MKPALLPYIWLAKVGTRTSCVFCSCKAPLSILSTHLTLAFACVVCLWWLSSLCACVIAWVKYTVRVLLAPLSISSTYLTPCFCVCCMLVMVIFTLCACVIARVLNLAHKNMVRALLSCKGFSIDIKYVFLHYNAYVWCLPSHLWMRDCLHVDKDVLHVLLMQWIDIKYVF